MGLEEDPAGAAGNSGSCNRSRRDGHSPVDTGSARGPRGRRWIPADVPPGRGKNSLVASIQAVAAPPGQRQGLGASETKRQLDLVQGDRNVHLPLLGARSLILDERASGSHRVFGPRNNHAFCGIELRLDGVAPARAAADLFVPPDRKAIGLQRFDEQFDPAPIFSLVGDEYVRHSRPPAAVLLPFTKNAYCEHLRGELGQMLPEARF